MDSRKRLAVWVISVSVIAALTALLIYYVSEESHPATWTARFDGPASGFDEAYALATDPAGNVYVAGVAATTGGASDYATVKYGPDGNRLWVAFYDGPRSGDDAAYAMTVDDSANVYVTGRSEGDGTGYDYGTIKYDADGNQLWVARYDGPQSASDGANAIAVDSVGNVYVTGYSVGNGSDYATVKYDSDGNELWATRYDGPKGTFDAASDLVLDSVGSVYVTGRSTGTESSSDYATVKYDSDGNEFWVARYNGPANPYDEATAIAADDSGNVYVTGRTAAEGASADYATAAYDATGNELWSARHNVPSGIDAIGSTIAIDDEGNVYVAGSCRFTVKDYAQIDIATVKYDSAGNMLWETRYDSPVKQDDRANAMVLDTLGNLYVAGSSADIDGRTDVLTIKYDGDGKELWHALYNGPDDLDDAARAVALDSAGNVLVAGYSQSDDASSDFITVKYEP